MLLWVTFSVLCAVCCAFGCDGQPTKRAQPSYSRLWKTPLPTETTFQPRWDSTPNASLQLELHSAQCCMLGALPLETCWEKVAFSFHHSSTSENSFARAASTCWCCCVSGISWRTLVALDVDGWEYQFNVKNTQTVRKVRSSRTPHLLPPFTWGR